MPADLSPVRPGNAERLSRMVQLATAADDGDEPFAAFEALLAADYPLAHARLALERGHHDFGLPVPLGSVSSSTQASFPDAPLAINADRPRLAIELAPVLGPSNHANRVQPSAALSMLFSTDDSPGR